MRITTYFVAHEEANGLGGLHPDASVAFSVERQAVALVVNDLEQQAVNPTLQGHPNTPAPPTQYRTICVTLVRINGGRSPVGK